MYLCHHPDLAGHCHRQWQVKSPAMQISAVSSSEITLSSSFSCSYILPSTPETIPFCSTFWYSQTHFLLYVPVISLRPPKSLFCVLGCLGFFLVEQWNELNCMDTPQRTSEYECACQPGVNFSVVLHIPSIVLGKSGWRHCHTVHAGHNWWYEKEQSASSKGLPNYCGDPGRGFVFSFLP